jgi:hypothetical protein
MSAKDLMKKRQHAAMAYDAVRGQKLLKEYPWWRIIMTSERHMARHSVKGTIYLVFYLIFLLWIICVYALFVPDVIQPIAGEVAINSTNGTVLVNATATFTHGAPVLETNFAR